MEYTQEKLGKNRFRVTFKDGSEIEVSGEEKQVPELVEFYSEFNADAPVENLETKVLAHALGLKIGAVNAMRTDGGKPYPVSAEALAAVRERYTDTVNAYNTKVSLRDDVSDDETAIVRLIQQGFALFAAINEAAETIIQSGDVTDPVAADPRWPSLSA